MTKRAGDDVDWDVERRKWAKLRADVRAALAAGPAEYVAASMPPAPVPPAPLPVSGESIDSVMEAIAAQVEAEPKPAAAPKAHLKIKASDIPSDMERLAQSWKKNHGGE